jgi:integrase
VRRDRGGRRSYVVRYRLGGRESEQRHGGSFRTEAEAKQRRKWIDGEMANMRTPNLRLLDSPNGGTSTLATFAQKWRASRIDVSYATKTTHAVNLARILPRIGTKPIEDITPADVAGLVTELVEKDLARESIRKTISTLAQVLDFAKVTPNPARDKAVKLPRAESVEMTPPTADHVAAVHAILSGVNRLALVVLDATGMRVSELEAVLWGDVDEPAGRWRVRKEAAKTRRGRWVPVVPVELFDAIMEAVPREDRNLAGQMLDGFGADRFRTALGRACKAAGVPEFSPHDLRHRRATLWHLQGVPVAEAATWLGHSPTEHLRTYAHASLSERAEVDHVALVRGPVVVEAEEIAA